MSDELQDDYADLPTGSVRSHFLDSGAFTLWTRSAEYAKEHKCGPWEFYDTQEHWDYLDKYAEFVKQYDVAIDMYANVDAIGNADLTYRNQKYLEDKHGLRPIPVVHYRTDLKWLDRYIDEEYGMIGLGGLVGSSNQDHCRAWIDKAFDMVCNTGNRLPKVRIHGFGVTGWELMFRYPWFSVDSTSWTKVGAYGGIFVPHKRKGQWIFDEQPYLMKVSMESGDRKLAGRHFLSMTQAERDIIKEWLDHIGIPLGTMAPDGTVLSYGVITRHTERRAANLHFFELMRRHLPTYPWAFNSTRRKGFGIL